MDFEQGVSSFSNMLNSDYRIYDEFTTPANVYLSQDCGGERSEEVIVIPSSVCSSQTTKDRRPRTKNFTKQEDEMLISAWQNISFDPITGVDQTNGTYWERVHNYYMRYKNLQSDRTWNSLMHRWSVIQLGVNKFQGFYNQIGSPSGCSEDDKVFKFLFNLMKVDSI